MKLLFDLFPVIAFFATYVVAKRAPEASASLATMLLGGLGVGGGVLESQAPILLATAVAILATLGQVSWLLARRKRVDKMLWISLAIIVVMGGATLVFRDPTFIKWKPTALYWAFAAVLLGSEWLVKKNLIRTMMEAQLALPDSAWSRLSLSWVGFFLAMGAINLYVAYNYSESAWVNFKLFGGIGLMLAFVLAQGLLLSRYMEREERK